MIVYDLNLQVIHGDDGEFIWHVIQEFDDGREEVLGHGVEFTTWDAISEAIEVVENHVHT